MKKVISKIALTVIALSSTLLGCTKNDSDAKQKEHTASDNKDKQTIAAIQLEFINTNSYNTLLTRYHDSLPGATSPAIQAHFHDMMVYYDNLYHSSMGLCHGFENQLTYIHTCGMMSNCQTMMDNHGGGMMMNGSSPYHCSIMSIINTNCATESVLNRSHVSVCLQ